jgi:ABC-2 type transport system permease protein
VRVLGAFLLRDLRIAAAYKSSFAFMAVGGLVTLTLFHFLAQTIGELPLLRSRYGADYFSFALIGLAVATCTRGLQSSFGRRLRESQVEGSLELLLASPLSTWRVVALLAAYPVALSFVRALALLAAGAWVFGAELRVNVPVFVVGLACSLASFAALGLLSSAFVLAFKRGDPLNYLLDTASYLFSGVFYPIEVMPASLQWISHLLPATYAVNALRAAGLKGAPLLEVAPSLLALVGFALALWPLAVLALSLARRHVERAGTLPHA